MKKQLERNTPQELTKRLERQLRESNNPLKQRLILEALDNPSDDPLTFLEDIIESNNPANNKPDYIHNLAECDIKENWSEVQFMARRLYLHSSFNLKGE